MKKWAYIWILAGILGLSGCAGQKQIGQVSLVSLFSGQVLPEQLINENGRVNYEYRLNIGSKIFSRNMVLIMTPKIVYNGGEKRYSSFGLQGQGVVLSKYPVVKYMEGINTAYYFTFPYEKGMENAVLSMNMEAWFCGKKRWVADVVLNTKGIRNSGQNTTKHADMTGN